MTEFRDKLKQWLLASLVLDNIADWSLNYDDVPVITHLPSKINIKYLPGTSTCETSAYKYPALIISKAVDGGRERVLIKSESKELGRLWEAIYPFLKIKADENVASGVLNLIREAAIKNEIPDER